jgi:ribosomal protein L7/L12
MVTNAPQRIVRQVPLETAETIKTRLERAGATVEVVLRKTP